MGDVVNFFAEEEETPMCGNCQRPLPPGTTAEDGLPRYCSGYCGARGQPDKALTVTEQD